jgi:hypothetical protein
MIRTLSLLAYLVCARRSLYEYVKDEKLTQTS